MAVLDFSDQYKFIVPEESEIGVVPELSLKKDVLRWLQLSSSY